MNLPRRIKRALRGDVSLRDLFLEALRLRRAANRRKIERAELEQIKKSPARLLPEFASLNTSEFLHHIRQRKTPSFLPDGKNEGAQIKKLQYELFSSETTKLIEQAKRIVNEKRWSLLGMGDLSFDSENFWRRDLINGTLWALDYHHDTKLVRGDGSDVRVLWELNRFGHALNLARAYLLTEDESFADEFFNQVENWQQQNPYGLGVNWACAMEVALRAMNLLTAFGIFRRSNSLNEKRLQELLKLFDQHGRFIYNNNEFSYISTSNHYLSDVIGLLWLGVLLPELEDAAKWRDFGLREMLKQMDKQVLPDGADYESSTGYHRLVTELFLYSFILCQNNGTDIPQRYWDKLRLMLEYVHAYLRPDGFAPLIGDADGGQILPFVKRDADDHAYLLALGAVVFNETKFKASLKEMPEEVLWLTGVDGVTTYQELSQISEPLHSSAFINAGSYIMRDGDLYLHFNANDCGLNGRGSHGHNDALSIEVSVNGLPFIVDPGSFVYNQDITARHLFRSTAYHSTVQVDDEEQNTTEINTPFVIGNEARPRVPVWETSSERDFVSAEHYGYKRLKNPVVHSRSVEFNKKEGYWYIEDDFSGKGSREFRFCFHLAPNLNVNEVDDGLIKVNDDANRFLLIKIFGLNSQFELKPVWVSRNYGARESSSSIFWMLKSQPPFQVSFLIVPPKLGESEEARLEFIKRIADKISNR